MGLVIGGLIKLLLGEPVGFDSDLFYYLVLPPIIFSAGYSLKRKQFFRYGVTITVFGALGTIVNVLFTACCIRMYHTLIPQLDSVRFSWPHSFLLASILSASDEVSAMALIRMKDYPRLGSLIFGEGVLNDVISIVLFKSFSTYIEKSSLSPISDVTATTSLFFVPGKLIITIVTQLVAAIFIGFVCGLTMSRFLKINPSTRRHPIHQTSLVFLVGLLSYGLAECFEFSGILAIFVSSVTMAHYSWSNLSKSAQIASKLGISAISDIAEGFAFAYVGLSMWEYTSDRVSLLFSLYMLVVLIMGRMICVFGICFFCQSLNEDFKLPLREQVAFVLAGLVRGCLCWAQATQVSQFKIMVTTTLCIVMTTSVVSGFLYPAILPMLVPQSSRSSHSAPSLNQRIKGNLNQVNNNSTSTKTTTTTAGLSESNLKQHNQDSQLSSKLMDITTMAVSSTPVGDHHNNNRFELTVPAGVDDDDDDRESTYSQHAYDTPDTEDVRPWRYQSLGALPPLLFGALSRQTSSFRVSGANNNYNNNNNNNNSGIEGTTTNNSIAYSRPNTGRLSLARSQSIRDPNFSITETYSSWYLKWLRFDYLVMKPLFGGSESTKRTLKKVAAAVSEKEGSVNSGKQTVPLGQNAGLPVIKPSSLEETSYGNTSALSNDNVLSPITNYTFGTTSSPRHITPLPQLQRAASSRRESHGSVQDRDLARFLSGINQETLTQLPLEAIADIVSIEEQLVDEDDINGVLEEEDPFVQSLVEADEEERMDEHGSDELEDEFNNTIDTIDVYSHRSGDKEREEEIAFGGIGQLSFSLGKSEISPLLRPHVSSQHSQQNSQQQQHYKSTASYYQSSVHSPVHPRELALLTPIAEESNTSTPYERYGN